MGFQKQRDIRTRVEGNYNIGTGKSIFGTLLSINDLDI
jgi:hypothetical protein